MSIKAMTYIWDHSTTKGNELLMLLAIADHAGEHDGIAYPGVLRLAKKLRIGKRGAQKIIRRLEEIGELHVETSTGLETKHGHTNRYYLIQYRKSIGITDEQWDTPKSDGVNGGSSVGVNTDTPVGVNGGSSKPSVEPSVEPSDKKEKESATQDEIPFSDVPTHKQMCGHIANLFYPQVNHEQITETEWGVIRKSASQLCKAKYLLDDVSGIYKYVDSKFESFTPLALCKHASTWKASQPIAPSTPHVEDKQPESYEPLTPEMIAEFDRAFAELVEAKRGR